MDRKLGTTMFLLKIKEIILSLYEQGYEQGVFLKDTLNLENCYNNKFIDELFNSQADMFSLMNEQFYLSEVKPSEKFNNITCAGFFAGALCTSNEIRKKYHNGIADVFRDAIITEIDLFERARVRTYRKLFKEEFKDIVSKEQLDAASKFANYCASTSYDKLMDCVWEQEFPSELLHIGRFFVCYELGVIFGAKTRNFI